VEALAPGLKTIENATDIRRRILTAFEKADRSEAPDEIEACLTFVVVGGGPTGVELAGAIGELAHRTLRDNFRHIAVDKVRVFLVEGEDRILPMYAPPLSAKAQRSLESLGVKVLCNSRVTAISERAATVSSGDKVEQIPSQTVLWAAGVRASRLGKVLADATGAKLDHHGRVAVARDCTIAGHPEIFIIGDLASCTDETGKVLPGVAPVAIQQGRFVAETIKRRLRGKSTADFVYKNRGQLSTIGRAAAVAQFGKVHLSGTVAWLAWLFVHLFQLVGFENRVLVFIQWAGNYLTRNRAARLITEPQSEQNEASLSPPQQAQQDANGAKVADCFSKGDQANTRTC